MVRLEVVGSQCGREACVLDTRMHTPACPHVRACIKRVSEMLLYAKPRQATDGNIS